ncbi:MULTISPECIES: hypothetical protein [unclassified Micromonospora]|uniref:hypothetical protein n=1 Tax=unclassified Micromonospora TaxID=2617518 RepID=UPI0013D05207|nr:MULTISPECIES: hypothetical protein [unclassified Micromonospora]NES13005.1 hypothetical protein [Micromonospora sp. PPF5-17B]NES54930.1 hypothetical protein [Micromonospora sp. PPF5-6]
MTARPPRRDWRDTLREATDLALLGLALTLAALPLLTLAPAVATASAALHERNVTGGWPSPRTSLARFGRALPAGLAVSAVGLAAAAALGVDLLALAGGRVPGGGPALAVTALAGAALLGYAGLVAVAVGRTDGRGWWAAARAVARACPERPGTWAAAAGVCCLTGLLAVLVTPVAVPILAGYALAALHAVATRYPLVRPEAS